MNTLDLIVSDRWNHVNMESACPATLKKPIVQVRTYDTRSFREVLLRAIRIITMALTDFVVDS